MGIEDIRRMVNPYEVDLLLEGARLRNCVTGWGVGEKKEEIGQSGMV